MSSAVIATLLAKNELSASSVTTHSCFLLSSGQEITRQFNLPNGWQKVRLYFKATLYQSNTSISPVNFNNARFAAGFCSSGRNLSNTSNEHFFGVGWGNDSFVTGQWYINGFQSAGFSGYLGANTAVTVPSASIHEYSCYVHRPYSYVTGSLRGQGSGAGGSEISFPIYN